MKKITLADGNTTITTQCYEELKNAIINGELPPGKKLKIEELKASLGIGQSALRESLTKLSSHGLVESYDNKGFRVAKISEEDVHDTYQTFCQIERLALQSSIEHGTSEWEAHIIASLYQLSRIELSTTNVNYDEWKHANNNFHLALLAACRSPLLLKMRADLYHRFDRYATIAFKKTGLQLHINHEEHRALSEAVLNRSTEKALRLITNHIMQSEQDVITHLRNKKLL